MHRITTEVLECQQQLDRLQEALDVLSDAIELPYQESEAEEIACRIRNVRGVLQVQVALMEAEVAKWGLLPPPLLVSPPSDL
jgi:uncharacterized protein (UPF0276 family)